MLNLTSKELESRKLSNMAQMCSKISSVPCYKRNSRVIFFFSDHFLLVAQMAQCFFGLLSLVLLTNRCAKGVGTGWHSQIRVDFTRFIAHVLGARSNFFIFKNFFTLKVLLEYK